MALRGIKGRNPIRRTPGQGSQATINRVTGESLPMNSLMLAGALIVLPSLASAQEVVADPSARRRRMAEMG